MGPATDKHQLLLQFVLGPNQHRSTPTTAFDGAFCLHNVDTLDICMKEFCSISFNNLKNETKLNTLQ